MIYSRYMKNGDVLIIVLVILLTLMLMIISVKNEILGDIRIITILVDGQSTSYTYNLSDTDLIEFQYANETGFLVYENGQVKLKKMSLETCPKRICSQPGWISKDNESIICLPNKIMITISGPKDNPVDMISF